MTGNFPLAEALANVPRDHIDVQIGWRREQLNAVRFRRRLAEIEEQNLLRDLASLGVTMPTEETTTAPSDSDGKPLRLPSPEAFKARWDLATEVFSELTTEVFPGMIIGLGPDERIHVSTNLADEGALKLTLATLACYPVVLRTGLLSGLRELVAALEEEEKNADAATEPAPAPAEGIAP